MQLPVELEGDVEYTLSETTVFEETCLTDCHQTFELLIESINEEEYLTSYDGDYVIPFTTTCNVESLEPCDDLTLPSVTLRVAYGGLTIDSQELIYVRKICVILVVVGLFLVYFLLLIVLWYFSTFFLIFSLIFSCFFLIFCCFFLVFS